jgi:hypothetical protein
LVVTAYSTQWVVQPYDLALLSKPVGDGSYPYHYERQLEQPYVDYSAGAFVPVRFVSDNSTLKGGESTWGWRNALQVFYASPARDTFTTAGEASGLQWVDSKYTGVQQLFWNQTRFEFFKNGPVNGSLSTQLACYSPSATVFTDNLDNQLGGK